MRTWTGLGLALLLGCQATLRDGLSEEQADRIEGALDAAGVASTKERAASSTFVVKVGQSDVARALRALERTEVARAEANGFDRLLAEPGLLMTPHEERARWAVATASELARSLRQLPGVVDARVHIALPDGPHALDQPRPPAKASVMIRHESRSASLPVTQVQALVAGAVEGLAPEQVTVIQNGAAAAAQTTPKLVRLGPIEVTSRSVAALRAVLGVALTLDLVLAAALIAVVHRKRAHAMAPSA